MAQIVEDGEIIEEETQQEETEEIEVEAAETEETDETEESEDKEPEPWQLTDEDEQDDVPLSAHIRLKKKLKGRISEKNEELETLRAEIQELRQSRTPVTIKRPREDDFDTTEEYETALDKYNDDVTQERLDRIEDKRRVQELQKQHKEKVDAAVEEHYERAGKLIEESGIDATRYKKADETVRIAVETLMPKMGDVIVDQLISLVGKGSEKVLYYLGNNKHALNEFKSLLIEDKSGMKAAIYIGEQKGRLNPKKRTSKAPPPTPKLKGDEVIGSNVKALLKAYNKAHKAGNVQAAWNAKKKAKQAGADVSKW
jgi:hypothetical protein